MLPYLAMFCISLMILAIIQSWSRKGIGFKFWLLVVVLLPCLLAGLRASSIGTDVQSYSEPLFEIARRSGDFSTFYNTEWLRTSTWRYTSAADFEIGYVILVWLSSKLFPTVQGLLFLTQAFTAVPIYWTLLRCKSDNALLLGATVYLFLYYNQSLNLMRQWVAVAFVLLAVVGLYNSSRGLKGLSRCVVAVLIGTLFHISALFGLIVLAIRFYLESNVERLSRRTAIVCIAAALAFVCLGPIASVLSSLGFGRYVAGYLGDQSVHFMPNQIVMRLPMLIAAIWAMKQGAGKKPLLALLFCTSFIAILLSQLTSLSDQSGRIGLYFDVFNIVLPFSLLGMFERRDARNTLIGLTLFIYCFIYWIYFYSISGSGETVPYIAFWS